MISFWISVVPPKSCRVSDVNRMPSATGVDAGAADGWLARQLEWWQIP
jgi:hypothetical protein